MSDYFQLQHDFVEVIQKEYAREEAADSNGDNNDNENIRSCQIIKSNTSNKRRKYSVEEQLEIIRIYDSISTKTKAIKFLQVECGYNEIYERKIKRWKTCAKKPMGRPISQEFESEALDEYKRHFPPHTELSRDYLRVCAHRVLNKEYVNADSGVMEQKWLKDQRTRSLQFTDRWITGILKRSESPASVATGIAVVEGMA